MARVEQAGRALFRAKRTLFLVSRQPLISRSCHVIFFVLSALGTWRGLRVLQPLTAATLGMQGSQSQRPKQLPMCPSVNGTRFSPPRPLVTAADTSRQRRRCGQISDCQAHPPAFPGRFAEKLNFSQQTSSREAPCGRFRTSGGTFRLDRAAGQGQSEGTSSHRCPAVSTVRPRASGRACAEHEQAAPAALSRPLLPLCSPRLCSYAFRR